MLLNKPAAAATMTHWAQPMTWSNLSFGRSIPGSTFRVSLAPASAMVDIATGSADFFRGAFLWYGLLRWRRVEVEQALDWCLPTAPNERL